MYLCILHMRILYLIPLKNPLFKNIPHIGSLWRFVIYCICVFAYLCICIFVFVRLRHGNIIVGIPDQSSSQKYTTCWVFVALCHLLYLCICVFVYLYFCICAFETCEHHSWYPWTFLFPKIYVPHGESFWHLILHLRIWHMWILFLISLKW